ncbi:hypothetical protein [Salinilacihabitans rarus]|uniref:hypothetical protein n=1 Tax=Salinilacihabitans rarus TaxID=2961596 RepID=UPI0020C906C7|nr:hypothetical protein [Salinilacihabitans rarus]
MPLFPPIASRRSALDGAVRDLFEQSYDHAVVYGDRDGEDVLHEGPVRVRANGWLELDGGRLLSPAAVDHVDVYDRDAPGPGEG